MSVTSRKSSVLAVVSILIIATLAGTKAGAIDPARVGQWGAPFSERHLFDKRPPQTKAEAALVPAGAAVVILADGRVLYWDNLPGTERPQYSVALEVPQGSESRSRVLDLRGSQPAWRIPSPETGGGGDMFCSDQRHLADGRVIVVGGNEWSNENGDLGLQFGGPELYGRKNVRIFDPATNKFTQAESMHFRRWYPALITLPDGRMLVAGGVSRLVQDSKLLPGKHPQDASDYVPMHVRQTEIFDPRTGHWTVTPQSAWTSLPLMPRLHLLPNGKVLYDGSGQMWAPAGETADQLEWNMQKWYDPKTRSWSDLGMASLGARSGTFSVMLPLRPPYDNATIMIGGGTLGTAPGSYVADSISELVTWGSAHPNDIVRVRGPDLNRLRWYSTGVVLPSGEVIAFSGADKDEVILPGSEIPVRQAEMYSPTENRWIPLSPDARDRTYHNTAVLLRDGSVLVGGHAPIPAGYGFQNNYVPGGPQASNFRDPSFEIFRPPYLFRGPRPVIDAAPSRAALGDLVSIGTRSARDRTLRVVLSRLPAATHITDADQRTVELRIVQRRAGGVRVAIPSRPEIVPAGYYYLFLLKDNGKGLTPSVARIVRVVR